MKILVVSCDSGRFEKMVQCSLDTRLELIRIKSPIYNDVEVYKRGDHLLNTDKTVLGITACLIGHMRAMELFIQTTTEHDEYCIIAEDDVRFHKKFFETMVRVIPLIKEYDIVLTGFEELPHIGTIEVFNGVSIIRNAHRGNPPGTQCYIISRNFAINFLDTFDTTSFTDGHIVSKRTTLAFPIAIEEPGIRSITGNRTKNTIAGINLTDFYTDHVSTCLKKIEEYEIGHKTRQTCQTIAKLYLEIGDVYNTERWAMNAYNIEKHPEALYFLIQYFRSKGQHFKAIHYYNLVKDTTDEDFADGLLFEYSICRYYVDGNKVNGTKMMVNFINKYTTFKDICMINLPYYLPRLVSMFGSKRILIDNADRRLGASDSSIIPPGFYASNISLLKIGDNLIGNVRLINYKIINGCTLYTDKEFVNRSKNLCLFIDPMSLDIFQTLPIEDVLEDIVPNTTQDIKGIEDIRLFHKDGVICYSAATKEYSYNNNIRIITGIYNYEKGKLESNNVLRYPIEMQCEKNWIFIDDNVIYSWYPMTIGKIVNNEFRTHTIYNLPNIFETMRGSTCAVKRGDEYWCITHTTHMSKYIHYFIVLDKSLKPVKMSIPFCFKEYGIEYCLGLYCTSTDFILTCSYDDVNTEFIRIPISWVENVLITNI